MAEKELQAAGNKKYPKKSIIIVIIVAALALVVGGGAGVYFYMNKLSKDVGGSEQINEGHKEQSETTGLYYYDFSKPLIVDFPKGSSARLIQVSLAVQVEGRETLDALKKHDPMIRNNLLMLISSANADSLNTRAGKEQLRADILATVGAALQEMTGKNHVKQVFFTAFVMQ